MMNNRKIETALVEYLAACFADYSDADVRLCCGYENEKRELPQITVTAITKTREISGCGFSRYALEIMVETAVGKDKDGSIIDSMVELLENSVEVDELEEILNDGFADGFTFIFCGDTGTEGEILDRINTFTLDLEVFANV